MCVCVYVWITGTDLAKSIRQAAAHTYLRLELLIYEERSNSGSDMGGKDPE